MFLVSIINPFKILIMYKTFAQQWRCKTFLAELEKEHVLADANAEYEKKNSDCRTSNSGCLLSFETYFWAVTCIFFSRFDICNAINFEIKSNFSHIQILPLSSFQLKFSLRSSLL